MNISDIWMRLESLAHLRDLGPRYKALHDKLAKELEDHSASLEPKPVPQAPLPAVVAAANPKPLSEAEAKAMAEQAEARREAARRNAEVLAGRPEGMSYAEQAAARDATIRQPTVGQQDKTDAELAAERGPIDHVTHEPIGDIERRI